MTRFTYRNLCDIVRKTGCRGCLFIRDALACLLRVRDATSPASLPRLCRTRAWKGLHLYDGRDFVLEFYSLEEFVLQPSDGNTSCLKDSPILRNISGDTASEAAFSWAFSTLNSCMKSHDQCGDQSTKPKLPTRVLDIGDDNDYVKVYESSYRERAQYMCLSHCWGRSQPVRTMKKNYQEYKQQIPFSSLCKTFQDAVIFTRRLNIRYLWIDSLCIIQDNPEDWRRESSRMGLIFQNSFLTLAAAKSSDSSGGCFYNASPWSLGCKLDENSFHEGIPLYVRQRLPERGLVSEAAWSNHFPLLNRAWVYQERILSPRLLYFGEELVWECATNMTCECGRLDAYKSTIKMKHGKVISAGSIEAVASRWREMVGEYSGMKLTYESDRLPALSGLAKQIQNFRTGRYIAGLWEDSLTTDLLWHSQTPASNRLKVWRAPTWSWASIEPHNGVRYGIELNIFPAKSCCTILDASARYFSSDPTGKVLSGHLRVSGLVTSVILNDDFSRILKAVENSKELFLWDYTLENNSDRRADSRQVLYCLKVATCNIYTYSLVLRCLDEKSRAFERVGLLRQPDLQGSLCFPLYDENQAERVITIF